MVNVACAQEATQSTTAAAPQSTASTTSNAQKNVKTLNTVTVTAEKRSEALLDVPVPVTVVEPISLIQNNELQVSDFYTQVPGLSYSRGVVAIRGITTGTFGNPTVGYTIDDVPFGSTVANGDGSGNGGAVPDIDPYDLQQIEVLRGPQGTLYGAASMGGLIKYDTVDPQTGNFGGRIEVDTQDIDHGGAHHAGIPAGAEHAERQGRQDDVVRRAEARHGKPAKGGGKDVEEQQRHHELRRGDADEGKHHDGPVDKAAAPDRGDDAEGQTEHDLHDYAGRHQHERGRQARDDQGQHLGLLRIGAAEIAMQQPAQIVQELHDERLVEAEFVADGGDHLRGRRTAGDQHVRCGRCLWVPPAFGNCGIL